MAGEHGGHVRRDALLAAGMPPGWIDHQVRLGELIRVYHGVYAVGHVPRDPKSRAHAALLAVGDRSALTGPSAASLYGVYKTWREPFHVITPQNRRPAGIKTRQCRTPLGRDIRTVDGLQVTGPARTALDLAPHMSDDRLHGAVDHLRLRHGLKLEQLADVINRNPRHPGAKRLRRVAGLLSKNPTRSAFERRWRSFAKRYGIPEDYDINTHVNGHEADVLFPGRLIVELDTLDTHLLNFETDRRRDAENLAKSGIPTLRCTWERFKAEPAGVAEEILQVLARTRAA